MNKDPANSVVDALSTARACWELASDGVKDGCLSTVVASTVSRAAFEAAASIQRMLDAYRPSLSPEGITLLSHCIIDLETIAALASLAATSEGSANSAFHLAHALSATAKMAVNNLARAEQAMP